MCSACRATYLAVQMLSGLRGLETAHMCRLSLQGRGTNILSRIGPQPKVLGEAWAPFQEGGSEREGLRRCVCSL